MKPPSGPKKQTQNKPNSNPIRQACVVCEGVAGLIKACPELAEALSAAEGAVEWANFFKGQNRLPENLATPSKTKGPGKKWILFEQSYILAGNLLKSRTFWINNVQA